MCKFVCIYFNVIPIFYILEWSLTVSISILAVVSEVEVDDGVAVLPAVRDVVVASVDALRLTHAAVSVGLVDTVAVVVIEIGNPELEFLFTFSA